MATFANPRETWNARFAVPEFLFGEEPNAFVRDTAMRFLRPRERVLCVADGEGRNSVWLAQQGLGVTAFDFAENAVLKARELAARRGVQVDHHVCDLAHWRFEPASVDAIVAVFIQFLDPVPREAAFAAMKAAVKPGGYFLLEGYTPGQLRYRTGGPGTVENLYTREWAQRTFADWDIVELRDYETELAEGARHVGMSALLDVVARRRA